jgi:cytochrome bd-type quinol oxidase subunit 1
MDKSSKLTILRWSARIIAAALFIFGLLFYFGYGNPLPFANPDYTWIENIWLTLVPLIFIGLAVGWKFEKVGGYLIILPLIIGFILGVIAEASFSMNMLVLLVPGILYLIVGYKSSVPTP